MENKFKFLTKYSLSKKLKNKWFIIANVIVAIIVVGLINIDSIVGFFGGDFNDDIKIKVVDNAGYYDVVKANLQNADKYLSDTKIKVSKEKNSVSKAKKSLEDTKDILMVINKDEKNVFNVEFISDAYVDMVKYQVITACLNNAKTTLAMENANVSAEVLAQINAPVNIKRTFINEEKTKDEEASRSLLSVASLIIVLPCFMLIIFLTQMIGAEVNEEKSTRGMEIIIGNVSPRTHFFSKIVSSNLFVLLQGFLLLVYGGLGLLIRKFTTSGDSIVSSVGSSSEIGEIVNTLSNSGIINKLGYVIPLIIILLVLSFLAYSLLAGVLASMTTNMENYQQLQTPLMVISLIGYYLIMISAMFPGAIFIKVISCVPLISISLAPSLLLSGEIGVGIVIIAILLLALLDYVLVKYGLKIYKVGILNYSETGLWKKMFKAVKSKN